MPPHVRGLQDPTALEEASALTLKEREADGLATSRRSNFLNTQARLRRCGRLRSTIIPRETGIPTVPLEEVGRQVEGARKAEEDTLPPAREHRDRPTRQERARQEAASQAPSPMVSKEPLAKSTATCDARAPPPANGSL